MVDVADFFLNWNAFLDEVSIELKDIFQEESYAKLFDDENVKHVEAFVYKEHTYIFILPILISSIPNSNFYDFETPYGYSGPIINTNDQTFIKSAIDSFYQLCFKRNIIAGLFRFNPLTKNVIDIKPMKIIKEREIAIIDLTLEEDDYFANHLHLKHRNKIRQSSKLGIEVDEDINFTTLSNFQKMYQETMDRVNAGDFYYFDNLFFEKMRQQLGNNLKLFTAKLNGELIASCLVLISGKNAHYYLSCSSEVHRDLGAGTILIYKTSRLLKATGILHFNLGGGVKSSEDSLFKFKSRFTKEKRDFYIGKLIVNDEVYSSIVSDWENKVSEEKRLTFKNFLMKYRF